MRCVQTLTGLSRPLNNLGNNSNNKGG